MTVSELIERLEQLPGYYHVDLVGTDDEGDGETRPAERVDVIGQHYVRVAIS